MEIEMKLLPVPEWYPIRKKILCALGLPEDFFDKPPSPLEDSIKKCEMNRRRFNAKLIREVIWRKFGIEVDVRAKEFNE